MKFRFYQLYYIAAAVLSVVAMCKDVLSATMPDGATYAVSNFAIAKPDGSVSCSVVALGVVLIAATLVNAFGLLVALFSNFELQKRASILSMLLFTGYYVLFVLFVLLLSPDILSLQTAAMLPLTALILDMMAFFSARRTEAKILAKASGFRLRD